MSEHHTGQCHCGAVAVQLTGTDDSVIECNCSICKRNGWQLSFVEAAAFKLVRGKEDLSDYQFAKQQLHHPFCKHCGVRVFSWGEDPDGNTTYAINARCIDGYEPGSVNINHYDGASI